MICYQGFMKLLGTIYSCTSIGVDLLTLEESGRNKTDSAICSSRY